METEAKDKSGFADKLLAARSAWENYTDPKDFAPVKALLSLLEEPEFVNAGNEILARQMLPMLAQTMCSKTILRTVSSEEASYCKALIPDRYMYNYCKKYGALATWCSDVLREWPTNDTTPQFLRVLNYTYEMRFERWYKARSCDSFKRPVLLMLNDAIQDIEHTERKIED